MAIEFLPLIFFFIALFYSSVGFGGGSSYLAILSLFLTDFHEIRTTTLILNTSVVAISTFAFVKNGVFSLRSFWPFLASSIPMAYLGAQLRFSQSTFFLILGSSLILSGVFMIIKISNVKQSSREFNLNKKFTLGGGVGLLAGVSGIGGGIFLSPILNLLNWANPRTIASLASVFILVNSLSGILGLAAAGTFEINTTRTIQMIIAVAFGGSIGTYLSNKKFNLRLLGLLTAILVIYVGTRLILLHAFGINI
jgi:uncharacterized membrane protein YfcA